MRHETCRICTSPRYEVSDGEMKHVILVAETAGVPMHHHHLMRCSDCGAQWFDDIVIDSGLILVLRRDTVPCDCPEDDTERYQNRAVLFKIPEAECRCTAADLDQEHVVVTP